MLVEWVRLPWVIVWVAVIVFPLFLLIYIFIVEIRYDNVDLNLRFLTPYHPNGKRIRNYYYPYNEDILRTGIEIYCKEGDVE